MEWKADEKWMFAASQQIGNTEPWPSLGMVSGVGAPNPAFGLWIFAALGKACHDPVTMVHAIEVMNIAALIGFATIAVRRVRPDMHDPWLLGVALQAVNPLAILLSRKIWAQCVLPPFCLATFVAYGIRESTLGAFAWGLFGTLLGQIHLSGFFFQAALAIWALLLDLTSKAERRTRWAAWAAGSAIAAVPLYTWAQAVLRSGSEGKILESNWLIALKMNFFIPWIAVPIGLSSTWDYFRTDLMSYMREPVCFGRPTYIVFVGQTLLLIVTAPAVAHWAWTLVTKFGGGSNTGAGLTQVGFWFPTGVGLIMGSLLFATRFGIPTYYVLVCCPLPFVWLAQAVSAAFPRRTFRVFACILCLQFILSASLLYHVHERPGVGDGDYGVPYSRSPDIGTFQSLR
jgi:hypothetical protein